MGGFSRARSRRPPPKSRGLFPQRSAISVAAAPVLIQARSRLESPAAPHARGVGRGVSRQRQLGSAIGALGGVSPRPTWRVVEGHCGIFWQPWRRSSTRARSLGRRVSGGSHGRFPQPRRDRPPPVEGDRPYLLAASHLRTRQPVEGSPLWSRRSWNHEDTGIVAYSCYIRPGSPLRSLSPRSPRG
jgi:hypothetical protein